MPAKFTLNGQIFDTTKMDQVSKQAVLMAYLMAAVGQGKYGTRSQVYIKSSESSKTVLSHKGILSSPELNNAWHSYIAKAMARQSAINIKKLPHLPGPAGPDIYKPEFYPMTAAIQLLQIFYNSQDKAQKEKMKNWEKTETGKALGGTAHRFELKELAVPGNGTSPSAGKENNNKTKKAGKDSENETPQKPRKVPLKPSDMLHYANTVSPREDGAIEIIRLETNTGHRSWQVIMRGTERWDGGSVQPQDMLSNLEEVAGVPSAQRVGVIQAMKMAGIKSGEPVQLYGHSQAGIVAANLAADPKMQSQYNIVSVIDAGSPNNRVRLPANIEHTSFRNLHDPVWKLDCQFPKGAPNRVNIYGDVTGSDGLVGAHDRDQYTKLAAAVENTRPLKFAVQTQRITQKMHLEEGVKAAYSQRYEIGRE